MDLEVFEYIVGKWRACQDEIDTLLMTIKEMEKDNSRKDSCIDRLNNKINELQGEVNNLYDRIDAVNSESN